jgi:hypothetical protein
MPNKVLLEFNSYVDPRTKSRKLQILDKNLNTLAVLDSHDFKRMEGAKLQPGNHSDIVAYCNNYKHPFSVDVNNFKATVFE